jgi:hypothetical protein
MLTEGFDFFGELLGTIGSAMGKGCDTTSTVLVGTTRTGELKMDGLVCTSSSLFIPGVESGYVTVTRASVLANSNSST